MGMGKTTKYIMKKQLLYILFVFSFCHCYNGQGLLSYFKWEADGLETEKFDRIAFKDIVNAVFATSSRDEANAVIEEFQRFWMSIIGTRGATGKKTVNASTQFQNLFEEV